jgi:hypothetical protein
MIPPLGYCPIEKDRLNRTVGPARETNGCNFYEIATRKRRASGPKCKQLRSPAIVPLNAAMMKRIF